MVDSINLGECNDYKKPQKKINKFLKCLKGKKVCPVFETQMANATHILLQRSTMKIK